MPSVEAMPRGPMGHQGPMDGSGILLETMQYEEPVKSQPVPNHLLETSEPFIMLSYCHLTVIMI